MPSKRPSEEPTSPPRNRLGLKTSSKRQRTKDAQERLIPDSNLEDEEEDPKPEILIKLHLKKLEEELNATKSKLLESQKINQSQDEILESLKTSLRCNICLETLDSPYTLLCGHIFCHKDLYAWFHRLPIDYDSELEFELPDSDFEEDNDRNERRRSGQNNNHDDEQILEAGPSGSDSIINSLPLPPPPRPTPYRRKRNLICPQCRTSVHSKPFQLYAIKEATDHLRKFESNNQKNKFETIEALSSSPKHRLIKGKYDPENHRDEKDSSWGNLFNHDERSFTQNSRRNNNVVRDFEDGVRRCIRCAWEIAADGICEGCGEIYSDVEDSISGQSDSSDNRWEEERDQNEGDESFDHDRYSNEEEGGDSEGRYENDDESSDEDLPISNRRIGSHRNRVDDSDEGCNDSDIETERNHESGDDPDDDDPDDQTERSYQKSRSSDDTDENEGSTVHDQRSDRDDDSSSSQYGPSSPRRRRLSDRRDSEVSHSRHSNRNDRNQSPRYSDQRHSSNPHHSRSPRNRDYNRIPNYSDRRNGNDRYHSRSRSPSNQDYNRSPSYSDRRSQSRSDRRNSYNSVEENFDTSYDGRSSRSRRRS